jgi:two-component system, NarL family, response regulator NreC
MTIRIILADDHAIVRHSLSRTIEQEQDIEVIGQAQDGHTTVDMARQLRPDLVLMDISMPDLNGIEASREIRRESPDTQIIALSMHSEKRYVTEMFKAGAKGYLLKDSNYGELLTAIRTVAEGKTYLSPSISDSVVEDMVTGEYGKEISAFSVLTPREREVLQLLAEGNTTKQAAMRLHISPKTVEAHRLRIMSKLNIDNIALLTKYAIQEGLTSLEIRVP